MKEKDNERGMYVTTQVRKWGNSLAIRIPSHIAEQLSIKHGSEIEMRIEEQALKLIPQTKKTTLEELLARVTPENRHNEIYFGVKGNEQI